MTKRVLWGLVLVALGVLYLLQEIGQFNFGLAFWPIMGVLFGCAMLITSLRRPSWPKLALGLWVGSIGLFTMLHNAGVSELTGRDIASKGWPIILIAIGLSIIFGRSLVFKWGSAKRGQYMYHMVGDLRHGRGPWALKNDLSMDHGVGDTKLDLSTADITDGVHHIKVSQALGEIVIRVPDNVNVTVNADVNIGNLVIFGDQRSGMSLSLQKQILAPESNVDLRIDTQLKIGNLKVVLVPAQPRILA